jgi:hypothetical protein
MKKYLAFEVISICIFGYLGFLYGSMSSEIGTFDIVFRNLETSNDAYIGDMEEVECGRWNTELP